MILTYTAGYCMINEYPLAGFPYKGVYNYQELPDCFRFIQSIVI